MLKHRPAIFHFIGSWPSFLVMGFFFTAFFLKTFEVVAAFFRGRLFFLICFFRGFVAALRVVFFFAFLSGFFLTGAFAPDSSRARSLTENLY